MIENRYTSGNPDSDKKSCVDCRHLKGAMRWWCMNEEARKERGTLIPGTINCDFWEPILPYKFNIFTWIIDAFRYNLVRL